ncbi:MAG: hypothetical protein JXB49_13990 [Bacteroidales bacterium]|nr:hypothetical protein [Bacteroidales bacterium]
MAACKKSYQERRLRCVQYRDDGYSACSEYEDHGYSACSNWEKNCCDWWPCSWICKFFSWICVAWVWITHLVCVAWIWISYLVCSAWAWVTVTVINLWCIIYCFLKNLFTTNEVSESKSECIYGWTASYRVDFDSRKCVLNVTVRIKLDPDNDITDEEVQNAMNRWEPAIENAWTNQFPIELKDGDCSCKAYTLNVDVQFVETNEHHTVRIERGPGRANMTRWFHDSTGGTAAHEVGHMFGNVDEYPADECPNRVVTNDGSIMRSSQTGSVRERHYEQFIDWISSKTCCEYGINT